MLEVTALIYLRMHRYLRKVALFINPIQYVSGHLAFLHDMFMMLDIILGKQLLENSVLLEASACFLVGEQHTA
jgi:hypothetical protein